MKKLLFIFLLTLLFCGNANGQSKQDKTPVLTLQYVPSYIPMSVAYELKSPFLQILEDRTIYFNDEGTARKGQLSKKELDHFVSNLSDLGLFELTMDTLRAAALDDFLNEDGSLVKLFYKLNGKRDSLTMGMVDFVPDSLIWKLPADYQDIPWYNRLEEKIARIQTFLHNFRPVDYQTFNGPRAAVFLDCKNTQFDCTGSFVSTGADSFYVESVQKPKKSERWPVQGLKPVVSKVQSFEKAKEVKITSPSILDEIDSKKVKSGRIYNYDGETFAVYFRPLFK